MKIPRFLPALLCAALCLPAFAVPAKSRPLTLWQVLAKHRRAVFATPQAAKPAATRLVYDIEAGGMTGTLSEWTAPPQKSRTELALGPLKQIVADDGATLWQQDLTGHVRIVRGPEREAARDAASFSIDTYDPLRAQKGAKVSLRPTREPGTGDYMVDFAPARGPAQTLYLDPYSFLLRKMVTAKSGLSGSVIVDGYTLVDGEQVPSRLRIQYAGVPLLIAATLREHARLASVDPALFAPPSAKISDVTLSGADAGGVVTVPYDFSHGEITLPVSVNGHALRLVLDSGAGTSFLTADAANAIGLTTQGQVPAVGYGGAATSGVAIGVTLNVADKVTLTGQSLYVLQDPNIAKILTERGGVDGGLGYDVLARLVTTVDYARGTVSFAVPGALSPPANATLLPVSLEGSIPLVTGTVDGKAAGRFALDTGDGGALHLYAGFARANNLMVDKSAPGARTITGAGVGGLVTETVTPGHTLSLGGRTVNNLLLATSDAPGVSSLSGLAGGIGNAALKAFGTVTFDYASGRVWLGAPAANGLASPSPQTGGGLAQPLPPRSGSPVQRDAAAPTHLPLISHSSPTHLPLISHSSPTPVLLDAPPNDILARHLAALGGADAINAITSTRVEMTVQTGGLSGTVSTVYAAPGRERQEIHLGILSTTDGYDGKSAWRQDSNGNVRLLGDDERRELRLQLFLDTYAYALPGGGPIGGRAAVRPQTEAGTGNYIVDVLPDGGKPATLFLDPKTLLVVRETHQADDRPVTTTYADYRAVNGVQFPYSQRTTNGASKYDVTSQVTHLVNNDPVDAAQFSPPPSGGAGVAQFITPGAHAATVPFDFDDGEIAVPVLLNGVKTRVFLDSGASGFALSKSVADMLHLKQEGVLEARGYGGSTDLHPVQLDTLEIPRAVRLTKLNAVSIALPDGFDQSLSRPVAGFIGYDLLSRFVVKIDYARRALTFTDPSAFVPAPADGVPLALNLDSDVPSVAARLDFFPPASFLLDTGDESALRLYGPYVKANTLDAKYPKHVASVGGGIGGASQSSLTRTGSFTVAGTTLRSVPTEFSLDAQGGASQIFAGAMGGGLLSRFTVTFDYPHSRVFFAPGPRAAGQFDLRTSGLTLAVVRDKKDAPHIVVADIAPDAPARLTGVKLYDQILRVDGQDAAKLGLPAVRRLLSPAEDGGPRTLLLMTPQGLKHTARVALYDPLS